MARCSFSGTQLHAASLERQQKKGRVVLRRLNGTEYENTLRDLLGTSVALKEMLPEDNTAAGFDNVSSGLDLSATHFLLYQEAAAKAVASAVPINPPIPFSDMRTGREMTEKGPNFKQGLGAQLQARGRRARHLQQAAALRALRHGAGADGGALQDHDVGLRGRRGGEAALRRPHDGGAERARRPGAARGARYPAWQAARDRVRVRPRAPPGIRGESAHHLGHPAASRSRSRNTTAPA